RVLALLFARRVRFVARGLAAAVLLLVLAFAVEVLIVLRPAPADDGVPRSSTTPGEHVSPRASERGSTASQASRLPLRLRGRLVRAAIAIAPDPDADGARSAARTPMSTSRD